MEDESHIMYMRVFMYCALNPAFLFQISVPCHLLQAWCGTGCGSTLARHSSVTNVKCDSVVE